ncbi:MAG: tRNA-(ms[2]io[6]A)-hydroxylase [Proteobacteria bacterium]|nr:MAG: tRNA-(ms[2]io[6]A)-hydroxylase [Pseudomonadota bacterium]
MKDSTNSTDSITPDDPVLKEIIAFLGCDTPDTWIQAAIRNQSLLLIDHAHCEKKAASSALNLMYRYVDDFELLNKMSRLAREELRHFEQVLAIMKKRGVAYTHLTPSRYAGGLRKEVRTSDPERLVDLLVVGAIIEARSCERFARIAPYLDEELKKFYLSLLKSEGRHYQDYLKLARKVAKEKEEVFARVTRFLSIENELINTPDDVFRFHSGIPEPVQ